MKRFERKYRILGMDYSIVHQQIRSHPAGFRTLYPDRQINNVYFDTPDLELFRDNLAGIGSRRKYRVRWYGEDIDIISSPRLETKMRDNELGEKIVRELPGEIISSINSLSYYISKDLSSNYSIDPVLMNTYKRSYLISNDKKFRATIDRNMKFYSLNLKKERSFFPVADYSCIVEIKYDEHHDDDWDHISQSMPFRSTKNSKYITGILLTSDF